MATVFSVQADSPEECERELARLCEVLGLVPSLRPCRSVGTDRWMARAQVREVQGRQSLR
jgi:hypothetical protein